MSESPNPHEPKRRGFPRGAIKAIAAAGFFCALTTAFLALFAFRMGFPVFFVFLNIFTTLFLAVGSSWLLHVLRRT
jgi:hypothetical protein